MILHRDKSPKLASKNQMKNKPGSQSVIIREFNSVEAHETVLVIND